MLVLHAGEVARIDSSAYTLCGHPLSTVLVMMLATRWLREIAFAACRKAVGIQTNFTFHHEATASAARRCSSGQSLRGMERCYVVEIELLLSARRLCCRGDPSITVQYPRVSVVAQSGRSTGFTRAKDTSSRATKLQERSFPASHPHQPASRLRIALDACPFSSPRWRSFLRCFWSEPVCSSGN